MNRSNDEMHPLYTPADDQSFSRDMLRLKGFSCIRLYERQVTLEKTSGSITDETNINMAVECFKEAMITGLAPRK